MRVLAGAPFQIPPWQRSAMHRTRNADHAGAAPAGGSLSNGGRDVTASIRSCEDRRAGAAPVGLPISKSARCRNRRGGGLQTRSYPVRVRARAPLSEPSANSRTTQWHCVDRGAIAAPAAMQLPLRVCWGRYRAWRSPWLHHFIGHEEDSNPRRSDRRTRGAIAPSCKTRSAICVARRSGKHSGQHVLARPADLHLSLPPPRRCPTISNSAKALVATHAAGIGERPVQLRLADRFAL